MSHITRASCSRGKAAWGDRVTTIFPKQGHYALEDPPRDGASVDRTIETIGDLLGQDLSTRHHALRTESEPSASEP